MLFLKRACYLIIANHQVIIKICIDVNRVMHEVIAYKDLLKCWLEIRVLSKSTKILTFEFTNALLDIHSFSAKVTTCYEEPSPKKDSHWTLELLEINQTKLNFHKHIPKYNIGLLSLPNNVWKIIVFAPFLIIIILYYRNQARNN